MTKTALIINAHSRSGRDFSHQWEHIAQKRKLTDWKVYIVTNPKRLPKVFAQVKEYDPSLIVVGGGDGTVSAAFNALQSGVDADFAVLPLGTSNVFARSLDLPLSYEQCLDCIESGKTRPVALGKVNDRFFVSLATIGFTVTVSENVSNEVKGRLGRVGYILSAFWHGLSHKAFRATIATLENDDVAVTTHQLLIANSEIAFPADVTFGSDVFEPKVAIISYADHERKLPHIHALVQSLFRRKPTGGTFKTSTAYAEIATSRRKRVALDGELYTKTPVTVSVVKDAVVLRVP